MPTLARSSSAFLFLLAACGGSAKPQSPPLLPHACEDAYQDLTKYFASNPEQRRPPGLQAEPFINTCEQLPPLAQSCMLFSYMQAHPNECDEAIRQAPVEVMNRLSAMGGH